MDDDEDDDEFVRLVTDITTIQACVWCNESFTDEAAIGRLQCRRHPGLTQCVGVPAYGTEAGSYTCCGRRPTRLRNDGCVECDHTASPVGMPEAYTMPLARARILFGNDVTRTRNVVVSDDGFDVTFIRVRHSDSLCGGWEGRRFCTETLDDTRHVDV
jgi:hypothetical protein